MRNKANIPSLISIVGVDGCGKTTLAGLLEKEFHGCGIEADRIWSRFRNYLSKPLLAFTRLSGHNYYRTIDGIKFGFHDFERLPVYRELFSFLQAVDVNLAAYWYIQRIRSNCDVVICERGPWDTLVDVTSDTGLKWLPQSWLGQKYGYFLDSESIVLYINRSLEKVLATRPELIHDPKIEQRREIYLSLANKYGWIQINNNGSIEQTMDLIRAAVGL